MKKKLYLSRIASLLMFISFTVLSACTKSDTTPDDNNVGSSNLDIWMAQKTGSTGTWSNLEWKIVLPDGSYFNQLPTEGFLNFSKSQSGGTWGTFTMAGNNGTFKNQYETIEVKRISDTELEKVGYINHLYKLATVDGVKLSGKYVNGIPGWSSGGSYPYDADDAQPMIEFTSAGTFTDKGAFVLNFTMPNQHAERAPGKGSYEIKNFTLILNYDDGRKITKAFSGVLNNKVTTTSELVIVGGNPFYNK